METGKTSKYFKYAIGEIVLVVIGILIALQINNWNENRTQRIKELKSLEILKSEFQNNHESLKNAIAIHQKRNTAIKTLLFEDLNVYKINQIDSIYKLAMYGYTYNPSQSAYNSLVSSGELNYLSNDSLKIRLIGFKDLIVDYQEDETNLWHNSRDNLFKSEQLNENMLTETKFNLRPRNSIELKEDQLKYLNFFENTIIRNQLAMVILHLEIVINEGIELDSEFKILENSLIKEIQDIKN
jgi:hypothetical protein